MNPADKQQEFFQSLSQFILVNVNMWNIMFTIYVKYQNSFFIIRIIWIDISEHNQNSIKTFRVIYEIT